MLFENRKQAGEKLSLAILKKFPEFKKNSSVIVLALPRGGVPVAFEIAKKLESPFDLILTHKLGAPGNPEFAIGAVAEDGSLFLDSASSSICSKDYLNSEIKSQMAEIQKRIEKYRGGRPLSKLHDKIVILVDDGIATGNTMKAAMGFAENAKAKRVVVAVPILPKDTLSELKKSADVVFLETPWPFLAIGRFYRNFEQLTDSEVHSYLAATR